MYRTPEHLLHQIEAIEDNADAAQPAVLELREMCEPHADRLFGVLPGPRKAQYLGRGILAQPDRLAIEAANPDVFGDLRDPLDPGWLALARAEKRKHVDRAIDCPIDIV